MPCEGSTIPALSLIRPRYGLKAPYCQFMTRRSGRGPTTGAGRPACGPRASGGRWQAQLASGLRGVIPLAASAPFPRPPPLSHDGAALPLASSRHLAGDGANKAQPLEGGPMFPVLVAFLAALPAPAGEDVRVVALRPGPARAGSCWRAGSRRPTSAERRDVHQPDRSRHRKDDAHAPLLASKTSSAEAEASASKKGQAGKQTVTVIFKEKEIRVLDAAGDGPTGSTVVRTWS